ncbi:hypothetical protein LAUMK4_03989 [Mycobacterium persicum]|uniref:Uncharacterized protein n=1 Tax=Mycobacterium persicum TaxID=1487726 RepID=A0ABY6RMC5_9MYCO|nr:hypothetical protein LAUMK15_04397 [Mycobacterium persicum]VAZ97848.1 hypothetical protein LAUMK4_03989 [Mycobacterium persicum]
MWGLALWAVHEGLSPQVAIAAQGAEELDLAGIDVAEAAASCAAGDALAAASYLASGGAS